MACIASPKLLGATEAKLTSPEPFKPDRAQGTNVFEDLRRALQVSNVTRRAKYKGNSKYVGV
jgi:hypothetical protein